jgi:serine/threonine-protein kinase
MGNIIGTIGRYQLDTRLGEGASGVVYRAYDPVMDRVVAIKSARTDTLTPE